MHGFNKCKAINEQGLIGNKLPCVDYSRCCAARLGRGGGGGGVMKSDLLFLVVQANEDWKGGG